MATKPVAVVYVGPFDEVEVADGPLFKTCRHGEQLLVSPATAGRAPEARVDKDPVTGEPVELHDPGDGLLAQPANWQPAPPADKPAETGRKDADR